MIYDIRMPSLRDKHREMAEKEGKKTSKRKKSSNKVARAERVTKGRTEKKISKNK